jgi:excisionase family DNA binding protein
MNRVQHPADPAQEEATHRSPHLNCPETHFADLPPWMTTQEAAEYSGYDVQYVRRLARQSKIGAVKKGRDWWIDVEKFTAYLRTMIESKDGRAGPKPMLQEDP